MRGESSGRISPLKQYMELIGRVTAEGKWKQQVEKHTGLRQGRGWGAVEGLFLLEEELVPFK